MGTYTQQSENVNTAASCYNRQRSVWDFAHESSTAVHIACRNNDIMTGCSSSLTGNSNETVSSGLLKHVIFRDKFNVFLYLVLFVLSASDKRHLYYIS